MIVIPVSIKGTEKSIAVLLSGPIFKEVIDISAYPSMRSFIMPFHSVFFTSAKHKTLQ